MVTIERHASAPSKAAEAPYVPWGVARDLMSYKGREVLLAGPAGTGKSRAALEKLNLVAMQRPIRAAIVRKVRKSLTQSALVTYEKRVLSEPSGVRFMTEDQEYRYPNGAIIAVCGLDDPEKIKSTDFDMIFIQEATELDEVDWQLCVSRLRNGVLSYQQLIADCNPADPFHWLKLRCDAGHCLLLDTQHEDNPLLYDHSKSKWTPFGLYYLENLDTLTGYLYKRLRLGLWVAGEGMYFTDWNPEVHIVPEFDIPPDWTRWIGVDYGFAAPWCCLWLARDPVTKLMYVYRERYATGLRDEQQAEEITKATGDEKLALRVLDPAMFNLRTEQMRPSIASVYEACGVAPVTPGMNSRKPGWAVVRRALACRPLPAQQPDDKVVIDPEAPPIPRLRLLRGRAPNLERTLPAMVHDPLDPEDVADKLSGNKTEDHAPDALRYALCAEAQPQAPERPIPLHWG
jgi:PBSX family phage terminase large subunit